MQTVLSGQDPSRIVRRAAIQWTGILINPNGILFGRSAQIDVNGLVASTLNISNEDFLAGRRNFSAGGKPAGISTREALRLLQVGRCI